VGLRAGLDTEARGKSLCPCRGSKSCRPVCSKGCEVLVCVAEVLRAVFVPKKDAVREAEEDACSSMGET
jgi:hypothetical protein